MYNEEVKTEFIRAYTNSLATAYVCEALFRMTEKHEKDLDKDICAMNTEELNTFVGDLVGLRDRSKVGRLYVLRAYVKWCYEFKRVKNACLDLLGIEPSSIDKFRKQTLSSPMHLQKYLDMVFAPEDNRTVDMVYRAYFWMAFGGIQEEDIFKVRCSDVNLDTMSVVYDGIEYPIYREAIQTFKTCKEAKTFRVYLPSQGGGFTPRDRCEGDILIRKFRNVPTIHNLRSELSKRNKEFESLTNGMRISYFRAWVSGLFYRTYQMEMMGIKPNFDYVAAKIMKYEGDFSEMMDKKSISQKRQIVNEYLNDYRRWKIAYGM